MEKYVYFNNYYRYYTHVLLSFLNMNISSKIRYNIWNNIKNGDLFKLFYYDIEDMKELSGYNNLNLINYIKPYESDYTNIDLYEYIK